MKDYPFIIIDIDLFQPFGTIGRMNLLSQREEEAVLKWI